jgi:acetyl esterase/lipase
VGSSFGARLATLAGFTTNDPDFQPGFEQANTSVAAVVGLYGYYGATASGQSLLSSPSDYAARGSAPLLIVHGDQDTFTSPTTARALAEQARSASANPVVYAELPGAQHSFDLVSSIRVEAVIDGIEAFAASIAAPHLSRADRADSSHPTPSDHASHHRARIARSDLAIALEIGAEPTTTARSSNVKAPDPHLRSRNSE